MHPIGKLTVFSGLFGLSVAAFGAGPLPIDLYLGGAVGASVLDMDQDGVEVESFGSISGKVMGGVKLNQYIGVEGQYTHFGEVELSAGGASASDELSGWGFAATGNLPIINNLSLAGRAGFINWETDDDDGTDLHVGGGLHFDVVEHFALRADWDYYPIDGGDLSTHMVSIGGQFVF